MMNKKRKKIKIEKEEYVSETEPGEYYIYIWCGRVGYISKIEIDTPICHQPLL